MTATAESPPVSGLATVRREQVEDFLFREAELLDDWDLDEWVALFTDDGRYLVPCPDHPGGNPARDLVLIDDNMLRLRSRVERLNSRKAHREYPHSKTSHQISNVRLRPAEGDELPVNAEFAVWRFRGDRNNCYVGRYRYRLRLVDGRLRIRYKHAVLANTSLRQVSDVAIIL
ncbi:aromatic-ring-hydroxylating dioxygenase subunit beta [Pseudonocardia sp. H11422]|uniref:aromatic-ring-hydroxylating dioxygenase subunit beta n=1 Tax=Pseudonocardia sp. H11422 TaxID=2835866 RepID=UPI001BDC7ACF|nr:aromatic-ring-hydroxylating dioxygenase subunit beta [Pseudonocardia sp. H11422]